MMRVCLMGLFLPWRALEPHGRLRVDQRPSVEIDMRLRYLNRGAIHGYRYQDRRACSTVEQRQAARPEAPPKLKEIGAIRIRLQPANRARELTSFNLAIDSKLRGCDWSDSASVTWSTEAVSPPARL
jgi:hypothetical protein